MLSGSVFAFWPYLQAPFFWKQETPRPQAFWYEGLSVYVIPDRSKATMVQSSLNEPRRWLFLFASVPREGLSGSSEGIPSTMD